MSRGWWLDETEPTYFRRGHGRDRMPPRSPESPVRSRTGHTDASNPNAEENVEPKVPSWVGVATGVLAVSMALTGAVIGVAFGNNNVLGAMIVVPVLFGITAFIARRLATIDGNPIVFQMVMAGFFVVLVAAGIWLLGTMADVRKVQDCAAQGRRNCATIEAPERTR